MLEWTRNYPPSPPPLYRFFMFRSPPPAGTPVGTPAGTPAHFLKMVITVAFVLGNSRVCPRDCKMQDARHSRLAAPKSLLQTRREAMCCYVRTLPLPLQFPRTRALSGLSLSHSRTTGQRLSIRRSFPAASLKQLLVKTALMNHRPADFSASSCPWPDGSHWFLLIIIYARSGPERVAFPIQEKGHSTHQHDE